MVEDLTPEQEQSFALVLRSKETDIEAYINDQNIGPVKTRPMPDAPEFHQGYRDGQYINLNVTNALKEKGK